VPFDEEDERAGRLVPGTTTIIHSFGLPSRKKEDFKNTPLPSADLSGF
jgi:hypothetical protein